MKSSLKLEKVLPVLLGIGLVFGIFWGSQQEVSWAAPEQHPDQQTVPPRPPTPEPNPSPEPPEPAPQPPPPEDNDDDDDDDDDDAPPPPPPSEPTEEIPSPTPTLEPIEEVPSPTPTLEPAEEVPSPTPTLELTEEIPSPTPILEPTEEIPAPGEDGESGLVIPQEADLSLSKTVDNSTPEVGDEISFTITLQNNGPDNATNIAVSNPLPAGLSLVSVIPGQGNFNKATGLWTISALSPGQRVILNVVAGVVNADSMANVAEIIAVDQFDPDSTPGNNLVGEDDQANAPIEVPLEIAAVAQPDNTQPVMSDGQVGATSPPVLCQRQSYHSTYLVH